MRFWKENVVLIFLGKTVKMNHVVVNNYNINPFFYHYFNSNEEWLQRPEQPLLDYVLDNIPSYITTIINFGCANGKDFIPFEKDYNLIGFDICPVDMIKWECKTDNLYYYQCSIQDYLDKFDHSDLDLEDCLVYTQGTLMYLNSEYQNKFVKHMIDRGCKNIVLHEYAHDSKTPHEKLHLDPEILKNFERKHFRPLEVGPPEQQPTGFLKIDYEKYK